MWCRTCQQDVPGVKSGKPARVHCPRCNSVIWSADSGGEDGEQPKGCDSSRCADPIWLGWETSARAVTPPLVWQRAHWVEDIERAKQLVASPSLVPRHNEGGGAARESAASTFSESRKETTPMSLPVGSKWTAAALRGLAAAGLAIGVFGGGLLGHAVLAGQRGVLPLGLICSLAGFAFTWLGLAAECDSLQDGDGEIRQEIDRLQQRLSSRPVVETLEGSSVRHIDSGHPGTDASPHVLLADLRRQLDSIAAQLASIRD